MGDQNLDLKMQFYFVKNVFVLAILTLHFNDIGNSLEVPIIKNAHFPAQ